MERRAGYRRGNSKISNSDDKTIGKIFQDFGENLSGGFGAAFSNLVKDFFEKFIANPSKTIWAEIKEESRKRPDLDGFEKVRRHRPDYLILLFIGLIMLIGVVTMYALSPHHATFLNKTYGTEYDSFYFFRQQIMFFAGGLVVFFAASKFPLKTLYKNSGALLMLGFGLCALLAVMGAFKIPPAKCELGACRWFSMPVVNSFQPSEALKIALLVSLSVFLGAKMSQGKINSVKETLLPAGVLIALMLVFVAGFQKDLGTAISTLAIVVFQFFIAGINGRNSRAIGAILLGLIVLFIAIAPHRISRISTFFKEHDCSNLSSDEASGEYHICRSKIALGSGGLFGVGIGNSVQSTGYLPEAKNDSIFSILGETFGFVGLVIILCLFFALIYRIARVIMYMKNPASRVLVAGVCGWIATHTVMNIAAMIGLMPLTGITIPLLSYGGTSIVFISIALGLVFNVSAYTSFAPVNDDFKEGSDENSRSRRGVGRTRYSSGRRI